MNEPADGGALCDFCYAERHESNIGMTPEYVNACGARHSRVLWSSRGFACIVALGPLVPGNVILVPRLRHDLAFRDLSASLLVEAERFIKDLVSGAPSPSIGWMMFEHGTGATGGGGGCVEHAHLQILPVPLECDLLPALDDTYPGREITRLSDLTSISGEYLYVTNPGMERHRAYEVKELPSQFMRRQLSERLGDPDRWNWRKHPRCEDIAASVVALRCTEA